MAGTLLDVQSDREPIDYTHFDCWDVHPYDEDANTEAVSKQFVKILKVWSKTVGVTLWDARGFGSFYELLFACGFENVLNLVVMDILRAGFDVYMGDEFVEIYKGD